jgi:hypothetical protein
VVLALGLLAAVGLMLMLAVRLSLAPPLTFATGRIDLFGSWALTRGRAGRILGAYALTLALVALVYFLSALVVAAVGAVLAGGDLQTVDKTPDATSL